MRSLTEAASNEVKEAYHINEPHFCMGFVMDLKGDKGGLQQKMPDFSFAICQEDGVLDTRHCVVVEVAYTQKYSETVNALCAMLHYSEDEVRLGILIRIQRPGKADWTNSEEWKNKDDWRIWLQIFTT